jgi:transposase
MSTSLLYHAFGIRGYRYVRTEYEDGRVIFTICQDRGKIECPDCGSDEFIYRGHCVRRFQAPPIGGKPVTIVFSVPRVECLSCGAVRQASILFADERQRHTKSFERYALDLSRHMTILSVARHLQVGWDLVKDIQKRYLHRRFSRPKLGKLKLLAIDEIAVAKGQKYLTVVMDLESGAVVFVGDGRGAAALDPFWRKLRCARAKIRAVAIDLSAAYILAVRTNLPKAVLVFDHFHVVKLFNEKLSDLRRAVQREAEDMHKKVLKGTRWLLLKNPEDLDPTKKEKERLDEALLLNRPLAMAYYLKEDLRQIWSQENKAAAETFLTDWVRRAEASGITIVKKFAHLLATHRSGILAWYDHPISTGPLEGTNNKIKTMKRQAYGFRDLEFFKLKILGIHQSKYALVG